MVHQEVHSSSLCRKPRALLGSPTLACLKIATETNSNNANIRLISQGKWLKGLAKIGIASGLLSLLVSVLVYGLEEHIHKAIETNSVENQQLYRLKKIDEYL